MLTCTPNLYEALLQARAAAEALLPRLSHAGEGRRDRYKAFKAAYTSSLRPYTLEDYLVQEKAAEIGIRRLSLHALVA